MLTQTRLVILNSFVSSELVPNRYRSALMQRCGVDVDVSANIHPGQTFWSTDVTIGPRSVINRGCSFDPGTSTITLAEDVGLAANVTLVAASHEVAGSQRRWRGFGGEPIVINRGCWLGAASVVLSGVTIGQGCLIGAGAVVTKDTEPNGVYVGVPARRVRDLDS